MDDLNKAMIDVKLSEVERGLRRELNIYDDISCMLNSLLVGCIAILLAMHFSKIGSLLILGVTIGFIILKKIAITARASRIIKVLVDYSRMRRNKDLKK